MDVLPSQFKALWICGVWKEKKDDNNAIAFLHFCYKFVIVMLLYQSTLFEVIELFRNLDDINEFIATLFVAASYITMWSKFVNFQLRKKELTTLLNYLRMKIFQPRNLDEKLIMDVYRRKAKWSHLSFLILLQTSCLSFLAEPLVKLNKGKRELPIKWYVPYSIDEWPSYFATYFHQWMALLYGITINTTMDGLVYGFVIHAYGQIELICHRLTEYFNTSDSPRNESRANVSIEECVRHHILVQIYVKKIETLFIWTITFLFFLSTVILCTSIFVISKTDLFTIGFLSMFTYIICMLIQLFFYCWYGNELELKSKSIANSIFASNWVVATPKERKSLLFLMLMSQKGLILSCRGLCTLSLETFTSILKISYSAFNLLQTSN